MHTVETPKSTCSVCSRAFEPRFRYQVREEHGAFVYFCSQVCHGRALLSEAPVECSVCARAFVPRGPADVVTTDKGHDYFCSTACRALGVRAEGERSDGRVRRIAVFNHKGGTGKTTTSVNLAAGLAERGHKVLLIDADGQGNVGTSLGIRGEHTLYHVIVNGLDAKEAAVPVRPNLDVLTSDATLAAAELYLAQRPNRDRILRERLGDRVAGYDLVVIDCAPALSLMNQNVLVYADGVVVPVSCDYLSLVGVRQVVRTMASVRDLLKHEVKLLGVVPTFFDVRNNICREAVDTLRESFGERCLPPIRVNTKLKEAPSVRRTIFEHAPDSNGAEDYRRIVDHVLLCSNAAGDARVAA